MDTNNTHDHDDKKETHKIDKNPLCYCYEKMKKLTYEWDGDWKCQHCLRTKDKNITTYYGCGDDDQCKYPEITGGYPYDVCTECYDELSFLNSSNKKNNFLQFSYNKTMQQINYLGCSIFIYLFICKITTKYIYKQKIICLKRKKWILMKQILEIGYIAFIMNFIKDGY